MARRGKNSLYLLAGGALGAAALYFFAPERWHRLRSSLSTEFNRGAELLKEKLGEARGRMEELRERLRAAVEIGKETYEREKRQSI